MAHILLLIYAHIAAPPQVPERGLQWGGALPQVPGQLRDKWGQQAGQKELYLKFLANFETNGVSKQVKEYCTFISEEKLYLKFLANFETDGVIKQVKEYIYKWGEALP